MLLWPRDLIGVEFVDWQLTTPASDGGTTLGGVRRLVFLSAGPFWTLELARLVMRGREPILAGAALQAALLGGEPILVRPCDCRQTPIAAGGTFGAAAVSAGSPFDDVLGSESAPIAATAAAAALRARSLTLAFTGAHRPLLGGEHMSFDHPNWGRRMYRVDEVTGGADDAPVVTISPPLREAVSNGQAVDFNRPGCLMQLAAPLEITPSIPNRLHHGRAVFVELPRKVA